MSELKNLSWLAIAAGVVGVGAIGVAARGSLGSRSVYDKPALGHEFREVRIYLGRNGVKFSVCRLHDSPGRPSGGWAKFSPAVVKSWHLGTCMTCMEEGDKTTRGRADGSRAVSKIADGSRAVSESTYDRYLRWPGETRSLSSLKQEAERLKKVYMKAPFGSRERADAHFKYDVFMAQHSIGEYMPNAANMRSIVAQKSKNTGSSRLSGSFAKEGREFIVEISEDERPKSYASLSFALMVARRAAKRNMRRVEVVEAGWNRGNTQHVPRRLAEQGYSSTDWNEDIRDHRIWVHPDGRLTDDAIRGSVGPVKRLTGRP